jgi:uncharacterized protein YyaL (SSP411 family)
VAIVGDLDDPRTDALVAELWSRYLPRTVWAAGAPRSEAPVPLLQGREAVDGQPAAYVCERFVCQRPVTDPEALATQLG